MSKPFPLPAPRGFSWHLEQDLSSNLLLRFLCLKVMEAIPGDHWTFPTIWETWEGLGLWSLPLLLFPLSPGFGRFPPRRSDVSGSTNEGAARRLPMALPHPSPPTTASISLNSLQICECSNPGTQLLPLNEEASRSCFIFVASYLLHKNASHPVPPPWPAMASDWSRIQNLMSLSWCLLFSSETKMVSQRIYVCRIKKIGISAMSSLDP